MQLLYNILWIDDNLDAIVLSLIKPIELYIADCGFVPNIKTESSVTPDELDRLLSSNKYNIIVQDYSLGDKTGKDVIETIRNRQQQYIEIILYSETAENINNYKLQEGIYTSIGRGENTLNKIKKVIDLTLKKVMDVNVMRGIVLASIADNDELICDILLTNNSDELINKIKNDVKTSIENQSKQHKKKFLECCSSNFLNDYLHSRLSDSSKKNMHLKSLCKLLSINDFNKFLDEYSNLLKLRNLLAHGKSDGDRIISEYEGEEHTFELREAIECRKQFVCFEQILNKIKDRITAQ